MSLILGHDPMSGMGGGGGGMWRRWTVEDVDFGGG